MKVSACMILATVATAAAFAPILQPSVHRDVSLQMADQGKKKGSKRKAALKVRG